MQYVIFEFENTFRPKKFFAVALLLAAFSFGNRPTLAQNAQSIGRTLTNNLGLQGRIMWVDATANIDRVTNIEGVRDIVAHCKKANLNTIVVDVKPVVGQVMYQSAIADHLTTWKGKTYPAFDTLAAFIEEGHKAGIDICASINVFSEGHKYYSTGLAYKKQEWQSTTFMVDRSLLADDNSRLPIRGDKEPEDPAKSVLYGDNFTLDVSLTPGKQLAVALDDTRHVAGIIDPALLDNEPLIAPEDGNMLVLENGAREWASRHLHVGDITQFIAEGKRTLVTQAASEKVGAFINPLHPDARKYEISIMQEIGRNYNVDGIVLDRMRYANVFNDYSDMTRKSFEQWIGRPVLRFPEDIIRFDARPGSDFKRGQLFKPWLEFRSKIIRDFLKEAADAIHKTKPGLQIGAYTGSWYTEYYGTGVNWGSENYRVKTAWATENYNQSGYAEFLDWLSTGCYYPVPYREDARQRKKEEGGTVEAAAELSTMAVDNAIPVYAGLYMINYKDAPADFPRAIQAAIRHSQGVMIFDISHIYDYGWWPYLEQAFAGPATSPHRVPGLNAQLRTARDAARALPDVRVGASRVPAVPFQPGGG